MKEIKTILLDVDGTLLDFNKAQQNALLLAFEKYNLTLNGSIIERYSSINHNLWKQYELGNIERDDILNTRFVTLFNELGIDVDGVAFEKEYQNLLAEGAYLLPGAKQLVTYLNDFYNVYIVTNGVASTQQKRLASSGLDKLVKGVFISESIGYQKPDVRFFDICEKEIPGYNKEQTLIVGDTLSSDILGGNNAGIMTCWYNPNGLKNTSNAKVDIEIQTLEELYQYV